MVVALLFDLAVRLPSSLVNTTKMMRIYLHVVSLRIILASCNLSLLSVWVFVRIEDRHHR